MAVNDAVAVTNPVSGLTLRADNRSQYVSRKFRSSATALGITPKCIYVNTPEQNGHIESFHKTLKKEYVWPREFTDVREDKKTLNNAFEDYDHCRIHFALKYLTPSEFVELYKQNSEGIILDITKGGKCE